MEGGASEIFFSLVSQNYALLILLLVFSFLFASFSRLKIFHYNKGAKTVVAFVIAVGTAGIIQQVHWDQMTKVMAGLIAAGIVSMVIWSVALQRGKLRHESEQEREFRSRTDMEERWRRENR